MGKIKRITFRADPVDIDAARKQAQSEGTTVNEQFRIWLQGYVDEGRAKGQNPTAELKPSTSPPSSS
jgi:hypothetical protein